MAEATRTAHLPHLSPAEFRIYSLLSKHGPLTIREIRIQLTRLGPGWAQGYNTVGTLLQRLIEKGYAEQLAQGRVAHVFRATLPYDFVLSWHIDRFLDGFLISSPVDLGVVLENVLNRLLDATAK